VRERERERDSQGRQEGDRGKQNDNRIERHTSERRKAPSIILTAASNDLEIFPANKIGNFLITLSTISGQRANYEMTYNLFFISDRSPTRERYDQKSD